MLTDVCRFGIPRRLSVAGQPSPDSMAAAQAFDPHTLFTGLGPIPMPLHSLSTSGGFHDASAAICIR